MKKLLSQLKVSPVIISPFVQLYTFLLCRTYCEPASPGVERVSVLIGRASSGSQESSLAEVASCPLFSNIENITFISVYCGTCHLRWIIECHNCTLLQGESLKRRWLRRSRRWGLKVFCHFFVKCIYGEKIPVLNAGGWNIWLKSTKDDVTALKCLDFISDFVFLFFIELINLIN